ncbi:SRPBCC family protein [Arsenicibacter rosenii]|uniref:ATPase n=1 Tax=Arsenicibacter rosenii TaxID=1750698 RepID=A0A1S2VBY0_9BACT|nr:SRPBCC domain-containing protein [Arsenicibacter rosenii]OIN56224.1 ATPase [Arsenicibacter rosenii]
MNTNLLFDFVVDKENNAMYVTRSFAAGRDLVWQAWTTAELLERWWAPKPYRAETKSMSFTEGGHWLYAMVSPQNEKHWGMVSYQEIEPQQRFSALNGFSDEEGNLNPDFSRSHWTNVFTEEDGTTTVSITIRYESQQAMETILQMGFKGGFTMGLSNLDELLQELN